MRFLFCLTFLLSLNDTVCVYKYISKIKNVKTGMSLIHHFVVVIHYFNAVLGFTTSAFVSCCFCSNVYLYTAQQIIGFETCYVCLALKEEKISSYANSNCSISAVLYSRKA